MSINALGKYNLRTDRNLVERLAAIEDEDEDEEECITWPLIVAQAAGCLPPVRLSVRPSARLSVVCVLREI